MDGWMVPVGRGEDARASPLEEDGWHQQAGLGEAIVAGSQEEEGWVLHGAIEPGTITGREFPEGKSRMPAARHAVWPRTCWSAELPASSGAWRSPARQLEESPLPSAFHCRPLISKQDLSPDLPREQKALGFDCRREVFFRGAERSGRTGPRPTQGADLHCWAGTHPGSGRRDGRPPQPHAGHHCWANSVGSQSSAGIGFCPRAGVRACLKPAG